jgi:hypothetical protein
MFYEFDGYLEDEQGNKAYFDYFGGYAEAKEALMGLIHCKNTVNCKGCMYCDSCSECFNCHYCVDCLDCVGCDSCENGKHLRYCYKEFQATEELFASLKVANFHQRIWKACSKPGALDMSSYHTCKTTHCRAGWAVILTRAQDLEKKTSPLFAGLIAYRANGMDISPVEFFDKRSEAMEKMLILAEREGKC